MQNLNFDETDSATDRAIFYTHGELEALKISQTLPAGQKRFLGKNWTALNKFWEYKELQKLLKSAQLLNLAGIEATRVLEDSGKSATLVPESVHDKIRRADKEFTFASAESDYKGTYEEAVHKSTHLAIQGQADFMRVELIANMVIGRVFEDLKQKLKKQPGSQFRDNLMRSIKICEEYHNTLRTGPPPDVCSILAELRDYGRAMGWDKSGNAEILMGKFETKGMLSSFISGRKELFEAFAGLEEKFVSGKGELDVSDLLDAMPLTKERAQDHLKKANATPEDGKLQESDDVDSRQIGAYFMQLAEEQGFPLVDKKGAFSDKKPTGNKTNKK